ncbi:AmmeMemoRadiSam system protein A [Candidatus Bipolaricaulota bacterium]|nr:AmmeMemoRadiSam system protein A [Candidatus Bipolaricaulota bacterium]
MAKTHQRNPLDPWVRLATAAVDTFVRFGQVHPLPAPFPHEMADRAGVFVSIKKAGQLRGCIGTFAPTQPNVAQEIIANAIKSASEDPRFPPIDETELADLSLSVDILSEPEACTQSELDPTRFGVIVQRGWRRGLLLPDLEGVDSVEDQIAIAKSKAGIAPHEPVSLSRFTVERHA